MKISKLVRVSIVIGLLYTLTFNQVCLAGKPNPLRDPNQLVKPKDTAFEQPVYRLTNVRVAIKDTALIQKDFPETRSMSDAEIDKWLIERAGYIAKSQVDKGSEVMTPPPIDTSKTHTAYRPDGYGRAMVLPAGSGLIDIKGIGSMNPKPGHHSNGGGWLGEMLREYATEKLIQQVLDHAKSGDHTIGSYAVFDAGFGINLSEPNQPANYQPAGLILRQAHVRSSEPNAQLKIDEQVRIEKILRDYGITGAVADGKRGSVPNIQGSTDGAIIDFGSYYITDRFMDRLVVCKDKFSQTAAKNIQSMGETLSVVERLKHIKEQNKKGAAAEILWDPSHPDYIHQPNPSKQIPMNIFGPQMMWNGSQWVPLGIDGITYRTNALATQFASNYVDQNFVSQFINADLKYVAGYWDHCERMKAVPPANENPMSSTRMDSNKDSLNTSSGSNPTTGNAIPKTKGAH